MSNTKLAILMILNAAAAMGLLFLVGYVVRPEFLTAIIVVILAAYFMGFFWLLHKWGDLA